MSTPQPLAQPPDAAAASTDKMREAANTAAQAGIILLESISSDTPPSAGDVATYLANVDALGTFIGGCAAMVEANRP